MYGNTNAKSLGRIAGLLLFVLVGLCVADPAAAVPSLARQTGQPCSACHVGAFGPQLTPFGRAFKIGGYTQGGGDGAAANLPVSAMLLGSFTNTQKDLAPGTQPQHYGRNNNFAMDQISVFLAGRVNDYIGGFVQGTFTGVDSAFSLDNTDLRLTAPFEVNGNELRLGLSVNNNPTVQDPYNSTFAWGFPYVASQFGLTPPAAPVLADGLGGNSIGTTVYAWYDRSLYAEFGLYNTVAPGVMKALGTDYGPGSTAGPALYGRLAYEWNWNGQSAHVGGLFMASRFNPYVDVRMASGNLGRNSYTDFALDGGYQLLNDGTHIVTTYGIYTYERQNLRGSFNLDPQAANPSGNNLNNIRFNVSYFYDNTYGLTLGWQNTWASTNHALYAGGAGSGINDGTGSTKGKPNANAFIIQADWTPFGKADSWGSPWANLKLGIQYTAYTQFNGATSNYDGYHHNASDNNTLYLFAWVAF
jgi:hypothetical protein